MGRKGKGKQCELDPTHTDYKMIMLIVLMINLISSIVECDADDGTTNKMAMMMIVARRTKKWSSVDQLRRVMISECNMKSKEIPSAEKTEHRIR